MYNTGNPVPSANPKDLFDNSQAFDQGMNSSALTFNDRLGKTRYTWAAFNTMTAAALAQVDGIVDDFDAQVAVILTGLSDDLGNKGFSTYAQMVAYAPSYDGTLAWVQADPNPALNGFYQWRATALPAAWVKPSPQPALSTDIDAINKSITPRKRPLGPVTGMTPMIYSLGGLLLSPTIQTKRPLGPDGRQDAYITMGDTIIPSTGSRKRPLTAGYDDAFLVVEGDSLVYRSGGASGTAVPVSAADAKLIQEQNQSPSGKRQPAIVAGQVWAYEPLGAWQLTTAGTWLAAYAAAFDIVRALKSGSGNPQPHSITRDGRIYRDGGVLLQKLVTGQSLALGSRGIVIDANGDYTIDGRKGNLFSPYTPAGYTDKLWTLAGGPRPANWVGTTAFEPVREFVSGVVGETPATSYMLAFRRWHERTTSISPQLLYSVSAQGGTAYAGLKKGTQIYANALSQVTTAKSIAASMGLEHVVPSISIVHGESQTATTQAEYVAMQAEWISDYRADIVAITGQAIPPVAFISQMLTGESGTIPAIPLAQLQAHDENPAIIMVGPKYAYGYFDQYHMTADGYIKMGELEARAERLTQVSGKWQPLKVLSGTRSGATITLKLNNLPSGNAGTPGPIGRLVADAMTVVDPGNYGFQLSAGAIQSVVIGADGASIVITATAAIAAGTTLTYALQPGLNSPHLGAGRRGCIRDTDMRDYSRYDNKPLYNWLVAFSMELQ